MAVLADGLGRVAASLRHRRTSSRARRSSPTPGWATTAWPGSATPTSGAASGPPAPAARTRASCCPPCTGSPRWPSGGCWAPTRARSTRRICPSYLDEFVFRFNRRRSASRGLVFYRLLELAAGHDPVRYRDLIASQQAARPRPASRSEGHPPSLDRPRANRPWRTGELQLQLPIPLRLNEYPSGLLSCPPAASSKIIPCISRGTRHRGCRQRHPGASWRRMPLGARRLGPGGVIEYLTVRSDLRGEQIMADASAQHPAPSPATVADIMHPPVTTVNQNDHVAAAAYLMKRAAGTALIVTRDRPASRSASSPMLTSLTRSRTGRTRATSGFIS